MDITLFPTIDALLPRGVNADTSGRYDERDMTGYITVHLYFPDGKHVELEEDVIGFPSEALLTRIMLVLP